MKLNYFKFGIYLYFGDCDFIQKIEIINMLLLPTEFKIVPNIKEVYIACNNQITTYG